MHADEPYDDRLRKVGSLWPFWLTPVALRLVLPTSIDSSTVQFPRVSGIAPLHEVASVHTHATTAPSSRHVRCCMLGDAIFCCVVSCHEEEELRMLGDAIFCCVMPCHEVEELHMLGSAVFCCVMSCCEEEELHMLGNAVFCCVMPCHEEEELHMLGNAVFCCVMSCCEEEELLHAW